MTYTYILMPIADIKAGRFDDITSIKQLRAATFAYIFRFKGSKGNGGYDRYTVYTQEQGRPLQVLWAGYVPKDHTSYKRYLLPLQECYRGTASYPPIHFALKGGQYNKADDIKSLLLAVNPNLCVFNCHDCDHVEAMR